MLIESKIYIHTYTRAAAAAQTHPAAKHAAAAAPNIHLRRCRSTFLLLLGLVFCFVIKFYCARQPPATPSENAETRFQHSSVLAQQIQKLGA